ncbi:MAG: GNAT family N-acetyltransferase [Patescibacteria group bacterium]|jgi:ribosomal protein S18 acetylase RimI-like enzyme
MSNYEFLKEYQQLQYQIMFGKLTDLGFASVSYCEDDKSAWWNQALIENEITPEQIKVIEQTMISQSRTPVIYFENNKSESFIDLLKQSGYKFEYEDSWMFHAGENIDYDRSHHVKKVENEEDLKIFIDTFDKCYQKDDPQNPFGELGDYLKATARAWKAHHSTNRVEYFIVYKDNQPVAVSTLTNLKGGGYISNVGSLREVRGEGFGKTATLFALERSVENGNTIHYLATEAGTYPNEFYKKIGFTTRFTAVGYKKS